jgi:hypothetical protein
MKSSVHTFSVCLVVILFSSGTEHCFGKFGVSSLFVSFFGLITERVYLLNYAKICLGFDHSQTVCFGT